MATIRAYIHKHHGLVMTKKRQQLLKDVISAEFGSGNIEMSNNDGKLNFRMRFQATINSDEIDDNTNSESGGANEE